MIRLQNVSFGFAGTDARAIIRGANLAIADGEWVAIAGGNGSGKTTLCRLVAGIECPVSGAVLVDGADPFLRRLAPAVSPAVGIAFQNPDSQFMTSSAEREMAFGMENQCMEVPAMESRLSRAAEVFRLADRLRRNPHTLSGGEKQRLLLASLWCMEPRTLVLDEPFSFLDRDARAAFLEALRTSFRREGRTIIWSTVDAAEIDLADRVIFLDGGEILFDGPPGGLAGSVSRERLETALVYPAAGGNGPTGAAGPAGARRSAEAAAPLVDIRGASFSPGGEFHLDVPAFSVAAGERIGVSGPSGSGKTTFLLACAGLLPPREGTVSLFGRRVASRRDFPAGRVAFLFQHPEEGFFAATVREEVDFAHRSFRGDAAPDGAEAAARALDAAGLSPDEFLERSPHHLSQGEKRLVALASVLTLEAGIYLLDEPTIFLDGGARRRLAAALARIESRGAAIVVASHDDSFLRSRSDRVVALEAGRLARPGNH